MKIKNMEKLQLLQPLPPKKIKKKNKDQPKEKENQRESASLTTIVKKLLKNYK